MYKFVDDFLPDVVRPAFRVEINAYKKSIRVNSAMVFVLAEELDSTCMKLSKLVPESVVDVECLSRIKCTYRNGVRSEVRDMNTFYDNLTEEQYKATQFLCNTTHKLV